MSATPSRILVCIAAAALFAAAGAPVRAGTWGGMFDPIGFHGTDLINIGGTDCTNPVGLEGTTFFFVNGFGDNNCTAALTNASVTLTDLPATDTAQLTFSAPAIGTDSKIWGIDIGPDGTLLGVDSFTIGPAFGPEGIFAGEWFLTLSADEHSPPTFSSDLYVGTLNNIVTLTGPNQFSQSSDPYIFVAVPEPGSLGLLLGALGAGWLTRLTRRRKAAA